MSHSPSPSRPLIADEHARQRVLDTYRIVDSLHDDAYDDIVRIASTVCDTPIALVSLIDRERQWFKAQVGIADDITGTPRDVAICDHAIRDPDLLLEVGDLSLDPRFSAFPSVTGELGARFYAGMPMVTPEGAAIGAVCVVDTVPRTLNERQRAALQSLARLTVSLFGNQLRAHRGQREEILAHTPADAANSGDEHPHRGGYSVVILELQDLAGLAQRVGERTLERTLLQLDERLKRCIDPAAGDSLDRVTGSGEFIAVLHGDDVDLRLRALQDVARQQSELGPAMLIGATRAGAADERTDAVLSAAKDVHRRLPAH
jgi:GAF domain-containing protein